MPIPFIGYLYREGLSSIPYLLPLLKLTPWLGLIALLKFYFSGSKNTSERVMHSKVIMITVPILMPPQRFL